MLQFRLQPSQGAQIAYPFAPPVEDRAATALTESLYFCYRARTEREGARRTDDPARRLSHLRAAEFHRQMMVAASRRQPGATRIDIVSPLLLVADSSDPAMTHSGRSEPRLRVLGLMTMSAAALVGATGALSMFFRFLDGLL